MPSMSSFASPSEHIAFQDSGSHGCATQVLADTALSNLIHATAKPQKLPGMSVAWWLSVKWMSLMGVIYWRNRASYWLNIDYFILPFGWILYVHPDALLRAFPYLSGGAALDWTLSMFLSQRCGGHWTTYYIMKCLSPTWPSCRLLTEAKDLLQAYCWWAWNHVMWLGGCWRSLHLCSLLKTDWIFLNFSCCVEEMGVKVNSLSICSMCFLLRPLASARIPWRTSSPEMDVHFTPTSGPVLRHGELALNNHQPQTHDIHSVLKSSPVSGHSNPLQTVGTSGSTSWSAKSNLSPNSIFFLGFYAGLPVIRFSTIIRSGCWELLSFFVLS